jgi:uncharacterized membrane protein YeaQ/YmgE (transglycosylase-associated protein family)
VKFSRQVEIAEVSAIATPRYIGTLSVSFRQGLYMMSLIGTFVVGLVVGFIARMLKPGEDKLGWIMTGVLGIAGSFLAQFAGTALGLYRQGDAAGWIASVIGAIILLVVYGMVKKNG